MLILAVPVMIILAISAFLFNNFYNNTSNNQTYSSSGNLLLYHNAMYAYAQSNLSSFTSNAYLINNTTGSNPYTLSFVPPIFSGNTINFQPIGDYVTEILTYNNVKYIVTSFNLIKANATYAFKTINAVSTILQTPNSGTSQNFQIKVALVNNGCSSSPTILNSDLNSSNVVSSNYQSLFQSLCSVASGAGYTVKTYVLMEALQ